jgi:hypothetical protein
VSLGYDVPKSVLSKAKLANARVFASAKNLATFTDWLGTDPESGGTAKGFPMPRSLTLGLNIGF